MKQSTKYISLNRVAFLLVLPFILLSCGIDYPGLIETNDQRINELNNIFLNIKKLPLKNPGLAKAELESDISFFKAHFQETEKDFQLGTLAVYADIGKSLKYYVADIKNLNDSVNETIKNLFVFKTDLQGQYVEQPEIGVEEQKFDLKISALKAEFERLKSNCDEIYTSLEETLPSINAKKEEIMKANNL